MATEFQVQEFRLRPRNESERVPVCITAYPTEREANNKRDAMDMAEGMGTDGPCTWGYKVVPVEVP